MIRAVIAAMWSVVFGLAGQGALAEVAVDVAPASVVTVEGEQIKLSPQAPRVWAEGTKLRRLQTIAPGVGTPAPGAILPGSIVVRHNGRVLTAGKDYLADPVWGSLGIGPDPSVTTDDVLTVDYRYSLRRLDSRIRMADGETILRQGKPHLTVPQPPALQSGETRLANLFVDYHSDGKNAEVFAVEATAADAPTATTPGRLPATMARIRSGEPVKIVCWGDSVTVGGDASCPEMRYTAVFQRMLEKKYPAAKITVEVIAVGGSNSRQWLWPDKHAHPSGQCDWRRIADAHPNLVTLEFVNDAGLSPEMVDEVYGEILRRVTALDAELLLITPHFTMPSMMGFKSLREKERRPYVLALRQFAEKHGLALADAAARWEHLAKEGLPYVTLLLNGINHPDDRGHALFAEEMIKCFADGSP